jgi:cytosine/adenosine deaminase-related metal-dependent hydrolase
MEMITVNGAKALGEPAGVIATGMRGDLAVFPVKGHGTGAEMLAKMLASAPNANAVWMAGKRCL